MAFRFNMTNYDVFRTFMSLACLPKRTYTRAWIIYTYFVCACTLVLSGNYWYFFFKNTSIYHYLIELMTFSCLLKIKKDITKYDKANQSSTVRRGDVRHIFSEVGFTNKIVRKIVKQTPPPQKKINKKC